MPPARPRAASRALGLALAVTAAVSLATTTAAAAPAPTPPAPVVSAAPLPPELTAAQARQDAADRAVAQLNLRIAAGTRQLRTLSIRADRARAAYSAQAVAQQRAAQRTRAAAIARQTAQAEYDRAHARFVQLIRYSVEQSANPVADAAYLVLTADSPGAVLDALQLSRLASENSAAVVDAMTTALDRRTAAERTEHDALAQQERVTAELAADRRTAERALAESRAALHALQSDLATAKENRLAAVTALSKVLGGWSLADPAGAAALNARYRTSAGRAVSAPLPRNPGHWTVALGQYAAGRALAQIGTPYAWAGGDAAGPTRGVCAGGDAANDCRVVGFDCSGLALYGWAPFVALPHLASSQYVAAGAIHPAVTALLPGDLVFWSNDGKVSGIHHVAVYVGAGNVVQAPQSGDIVRVTPLANVDGGYFGATRPLT